MCELKQLINFQIFQEGIGQGGPIEGYDIAVYHVETEFKLGSTVDGVDTTTRIWPICHPKVSSGYLFYFPLIHNLG